MTTASAGVAKLSMRAAMEARDVTAVVDAFSPDAIFHSPLTDKLTFTGREEIAAVTEVILDVFDDFHYTQEVRVDDTAFLVARARVGSQDIEMVDHLRLGPDGRIQELTVFFRPLPAATAALRMIGTGFGRRKSVLTGSVISTLTRPLAFMARSGDRIGVRLIRSSC